MDFINASSGHVLSNPTVQTPAPQQGGFMRSAANTLIPITAQLFKKAGAGIGLSALTRQEEEDRKKRQQIIEQIISRAKQEADPDRRSQLLGQARELSKQGSDQINSVISNFEQESGTKLGDKDRVMAEVLGVAGELGTWLLPAGKLFKAVKTAKLATGSAKVAGVAKKFGMATTLKDISQATTATQRILRGAKLGMTVGAISAVTDPEKRTAQEKFEGLLVEGGIGLVAGGATSAVFEGAFKAAKGFLGSDKSRRVGLKRLFNITPSKMRQLKQSTDGMDFEAEILARDAQDISGMDYDQLVNHFANRVTEAENSLDNLLVGSDKTINKEVLIQKLKQKAAALSPKKGNLGTSGAINELNARVEELAQYQGDEIPVAIVNNMKRDLQNAGNAAFSPTGTATPVSSAMADASTFFKESIEKAFGGKIEANRTIQLYYAASEAIATKDSREGAKIAGDWIQKFIQVAPFAAGGIAGSATLAGGGGGFGSVGAAGLATMMLSGAGGAARLKYLSPQVQTRMIARFSGLLENQGVQNAGQMAQEITQEISKQIARYATLPSVTDDVPQSTPGVGTEFTPPTGQEVGGVSQQNKGAIPQQLDTEANGQPNQPPQQESIHTQDVADMVTIRNKKTGEIKKVAKTDLSQFGLAGDAQDAIPGLPSKGEVLAAMILDAQKGGKNIAKLKTILDAYDQVMPDEDKTKPATQAEQTTSTYASRIEQSNLILDKLTQYASTASPTKFYTQKNLPDFFNYLKSSNFQSLEQAERNFLNAVLRRESGAVISPTEFSEGRRQYFPQPGDSQVVLKQKEENRQIVKQTFIKGSGSAYTPLVELLN